ncbi:hypothetical protein [Alkaliphilus peptidifermentans]|uniref:Uncharacterized protein n=1 Tax=Alkaliphilus peptidifermentans DSM 18978 TaxID=1120976 RepID=A0A1G5JX18_9FIRM|nr:hypothetical protein [Alkaliphilus peptidifermentans]SCY93002.1 hypothetical protein SAMN03080606_03097 [Alkaliphilus peptidifermentans DSM 18978]
MINIFLSINNREQIIQLPVVPEEFTIQSPHNNETYQTISQGDIKLIGMEGLKSLTIESFFPMKNYSFLRDDAYQGWEYVEKIEEWMKRRVPIRLVITDTPINMACSIDNFTYGVKDGSGDIYYSLSLEEFKFIHLERKKV